MMNQATQALSIEQDLPCCWAVVQLLLLAIISFSRYAKEEKRNGKGKKKSQQQHAVWRVY